MRQVLFFTAFGVLFALGASGCDNGGGYECIPTNGGVEVCGDGIDNDCDGLIDENCETGDCTQGERRGCGGTPAAMACVETCDRGSWGTCQPVGAGEEICGDGIDNDCDGFIDEFCECAAGEQQACGGSPSAGICIRPCDSGRWGTCQPAPGNPGVEICDGLDNDCNGTVDDAPGGCTCTDGAEMPCGGTPEERNCRQTCAGGTWSACAPTSGRPETERCGDMIDNDCDGEIDEPEPCTTVCGEGSARCEGSARGACVVPGAECLPGEEASQSCTGTSATECGTGTQTRTCRADCTYPSTWGPCTGLVGPTTYGDVSSCINAYSLGTDPEVTLPVYVSSSDFSLWFVFYGVDNFTLFGAERVTVELRDLPTDLDVYLYFDSCWSSPIAYADTWGRADERLVWTEETCSGCDDDGYYYVEVVNAGGGSGCFELYVNGLN